ncbi:MAG: FixH family protein [Methylophilaceae bacterium]
MPQIAMTETLFGGLLLAAFLFFTSRRLGLSNFWAGILSGAIPFIAYICYSTRYWPGGDVLAIHFAVYLATAGLLMVFGGMQQKKQSMHWGPKLIVGFFIGLVVLNASLLSIAMRGLPDSIAGIFLPNPDNQTVHTTFPGLIPHDRNKLYEPHLQQIEQQRNLGWQVSVDGFGVIKSKVGQTVKVTLRDANNQPIHGADIRLALWRMANSADDRKLSFKETGDGVYTAELLLPDEGRWITELYIQHGEDDFLKKQSLYVDGND